MHLNWTPFSVTISDIVKSHDIVINKLIAELHASGDSGRKKINNTDELQGMVHKNCHTSN